VLYLKAVVKFIKELLLQEPDAQNTDIHTDSAGAQNTASCTAISVFIVVYQFFT
jgi:hypothetical protein